MNEEQLWEKFTVSGKINDYIRYINIKEQKNDNS